MGPKIKWILWEFRLWNSPAWRIQGWLMLSSAYVKIERMSYPKTLAMGNGHIPPNDMAASQKGKGNVWHGIFAKSQPRESFQWCKWSFMFIERFKGKEHPPRKETSQNSQGRFHSYIPQRKLLRKPVQVNRSISPIFLVPRNCHISQNASHWFKYWMNDYRPTMASGQKSQRIPESWSL